MKKFLCIMFTMILLGSLLIIPISAADNEYIIPAGTYTGHNFIVYDGDGDFYAPLDFYSDGEYFYGILFRFDGWSLNYLYDADPDAPSDVAFDNIWFRDYRTITLFSDTVVSAELYDFLSSNFDGIPPLIPDPEVSPSDSIFAVFSSLILWLTQSFSSIIPMFFTEGSLTVLGFIFLVPLAFSVVFLFINFLIASLLFRR